MTAIQFYPMDVQYAVRGDRTYALVFGRAINGQTICALDDSIKPYFYIITGENVDEYAVAKSIIGVSIKDNDKIFTVVDTKVEKKRYKNREVTAIKIMTNIPGAPRIISNELKKRPELGQSLEYNLPFVNQYIIEKGITPFTLYEAEAEETTFRSRADQNIRITKLTQVSTDIIENPKILAFDIETYNPLGAKAMPEEFPILMISFYAEDFKKVITWKRFNTDHDYVEFVNSEADLIQRFKEVVDEYSPDIITGYFSDGFDMPYIRTRADKYRINMDIGMDYSQLKIPKTTTPHAKISGIVHLDIFAFIKFIMAGALHTDALDLDSVAKELLQEKKKDVNIEKLQEVWDERPEDLGKYCEYALYDSLLAHNLCQKMLPNIIELVKVIGLTPFEVSRMSMGQLVEWYLIRMSNLNSIITPNRPSKDEYEKRQKQSFKGGFVLEPQPGFYGQIAVFDFRSLYPTIIASHNISPGTLNPVCPQNEREYVPDNGQYWFNTDKKGFIPKAISELVSRRVRVNEILKTTDDNLLAARSYILKILANSFYGYFTYSKSRWYSLECAESITAWGRKYILDVIDQAQDGGFIVLYSDTDSVFLSLRGKTRDDALKFAEKVNSDLPELMELELEGFYPAGLFVSAKMTGHGAKKKYALLCQDGSVKIKGFETVKSNWSFIVKDVQEKVIGSVLRGASIGDSSVYVKEVAQKLKKNLFPVDDVTIFMQLLKNIDDYETIGPHVAVAKRMAALGINVTPGTTVKYVVVKGKGSIASRARLPEEIEQDEYDGEYYVNNQLLPAVNSIFEIMGYDIESDLESKDQSKLDSFLT